MSLSRMRLGIWLVLSWAALPGIVMAEAGAVGAQAMPLATPFARMESGEEKRLTAARIAMAAGFDPSQAVLELRETAGATLVARLTPQVAPGVPPHGGRVVVLLAGERRLIRLGTVFNEEDLAGNDVLVEVLQGEGRLVARLVGDGGEASLEPSDATATAVATSPPRPRRKLGGRALTSTDLIDRAEAAQEIDRETAVIYRVYAIVGDARLPAAYRGSDAAVFESLYLMEVAAEWDTYSPATQAALQPFLIPPAYTGSWANPAPIGMARMADDVGPCSSRNPLWQFHDGPGGKVRVWYWVPDDVFGTRAFALANEADAVIWPKITDFMGAHVPHPDAVSLCNGGDGRLDVFLTDVQRSFTAPAGLFGGGTTCSNTAAFINLNRAASIETLSHEIFHAFQLSFPIAGGKCLTSAGYYWWTEGSAQWIIDKVYPSSDEEQGAAYDVMYNPDVSFDVPVDPHVYSTYLLPFYYYRKYGNAAFVKVAWEACAFMNAVGAVDLAIPGGWETVWPELALHNLNSKPVDKYWVWDLLARTPREASRADVVNLDGGPDRELLIPFDLPKLSTKYVHYELSNPAIRSVRFWNGATFDLQKSAGPFVGPVWDPKEATPAAKEGIRIQALIKIKGKEWENAGDWTDKPAVTFCRDVAAERIEELVLIVSNSQFLDPGKRATPPGMDPRLYVSNMGCYKWTGTSTATYSAHGSVHAIVTNPLTLERVEATSPDSTVFYRATGVLAASLLGPCTGSGVFDINSAGSVFFTGNYVPSDGAFRRGFHTQAADLNTFPVTCEHGQSIYPVGVWLSSPVAPPFKLVNADGTVLNGTFTSPDGFARFTWNLLSEAQP